MRLLIFISAIPLILLGEQRNAVINKDKPNKLLLLDCQWKIGLRKMDVEDQTYFCSTLNVVRQFFFSYC